MADNKLNLLVKFTGIDKLSGSIRNIVGAGKAGSAALNDLRKQAGQGKAAIRTLNTEIRENQSELARVRAELTSGSMRSGLVMAERELVRAINDANRQIGEQEAALGRLNRQMDAQKSKLERINNIQSRASQVASAAGKAGAVMSVGITAPVVALAGSIGNLAQRSKELQNAASVAGTGFEAFQRGAYAASTVGIQFDKFGDILKDTQDKIGDFKATGGGEVADFFQNIAPKVGVTADSFAKLSGAQSLQLYYDSLVKAGVSQKEMVFYLEAIGDEASALSPLLANNGAGMKELGANAAVISEADAAGLKKYTDSQIKLSNSTQKLQIALANSGLIDVMTLLADKGAAAADWFGSLSPGVQQFTVGLGMVAAVAGPVLIFFGAIASAVATLAPIVVGIGGVFSAAVPIIGGAVTAIVGAVGLPFLAIAAAVAAIGVLIYANWDTIKSAFITGWAKVKSFFSGLPDWLKTMGAMMMEGLLMSLNPVLLVNKLIGIAKTGVTAFKNFFGIKSPSRLFMQMGGFINEGLGIGIEQNQDRPGKAATNMAQAVMNAAKFPEGFGKSNAARLMAKENLAWNIGKPKMAIQAMKATQIPQVILRPNAANLWAKKQRVDNDAPDAGPFAGNRQRELSVARIASAGALIAAPAAAQPAQAAAPSKIEIHIHQQPGEDGEALAQRAVRIIEQKQRSQRLGRFEDSF
ncbi:hypothetical protein [Novosphingobium sp. KN65.2]|uniref:hypothetical protein n=1 Tax=Novosphingobium sp. KN65.2 TaxID=1478134 RepID=UPI0005DBD474|nr:hypothetical protein [Novosphingobium sp. KN65.2]CDO37267.1 membrane hypothetical protein [Novosphingobium sp. KN65.2]